LRAATFSQVGLIGSAPEPALHTGVCVYMYVYVCIYICICMYTSCAHPPRYTYIYIQ